MEIDEGGGGTKEEDNFFPLPSSAEAKKPRKRKPKAVAGKVYRPNSLTEERPETLAIQYTTSNERTVLPSRARQTDMTLLPPGMHVHGGSFLELPAHNNSWHTMSPEETLKHLAADELIETIQQSKEQINAERAQSALDKARSETNYSRMATMDAGHINKLTPKNLSSVTREVLDKELKDQEVSFFMYDPLPSDDEMDDAMDIDSTTDNKEHVHLRGTLRPPGDYLILRRLYDVNGDAYVRRNETLRDASMAGHRDIEIVNKSHNDYMSQPLIGRTSFRTCSKGDACVCLVMAQKLGQPDIGYRGREYLTPNALTAWNERRKHSIPVSVENDGPVGLCYHDLKAAVDKRLNDIVRNKETPPETVNPFTVRIGMGEYAQQICWGPVDSNINAAVGISGWFPMHLGNCLQYVPKENSTGRTITYLAEVNADFQPRLSQANMCLGRNRCYSHDLFFLRFMIS